MGNQDQATGNGQRATKTPVAQLHDALLVVADRIYQRDKVRYRKLIVWVRDAQKRGWSTDRIRRALLALDKRESEGKAIDAWWPWLNAALAKIRTLDLERENDDYKTAQPNRIKAILAQIFREINR